MRNIEFRGKRVDNGKWIYGDLSHAAFDGINVFEYGIAELGCYTVEVDGKTVGQFIGRYDNEGDEIYDGDIISDHVGVGVVEYVERCAAYRVNYGNGLGKWFYDYSLKGEKESIEVIGNIHDNPELLDVK